MGLHPSDTDKEAAFKEADRDRSGQIVWDEFCTLGKQLRALGATLTLTPTLTPTINPNPNPNPDPQPPTPTPTPTLTLTPPLP